MPRFHPAIALVAMFAVLPSAQLRAQNGRADESRRMAITWLIGQYSEAREKRDTTLLKSIFTDDVDQLVSTGEWRTGIRAAVEGMLASSAERPGSRTLAVERIKYLDAKSAIVDCRYEINNPDGSVRRMWSSFIVLSEKGKWRISAIRNMLPAR